MEPRIVGHRIKEVPIAAGGYALVIRIPSSWTPPHRVAFGGTNRFYARNSAGVYELNVEQLRSVFLGAEDATRRLDEFRVSRVARLNAEGHGIGLVGPGHLMLHLLPLSPSLNRLDVDRAARNTQPFDPLGDSGHSTRFNLDGLLLTSGNPEGGRYIAYTQVFRDGRLEAGLGEVLMDHREKGVDRALAYGGLIPDLLRAIPRFVHGLTSNGFAAPFVLMISLLSVRGSAMLSERSWSRSVQMLDRDHLLFEPVVLDRAPLPEGWETSLRPVFDAWWNAYGWSRCHVLFDESGVFTGVPRHW